MGLLTILYLIGSVTFILGLKMLSNPATARKGNLLAAAGMVVAILGTIFLYQDEEGQKLEITVGFLAESLSEQSWERLLQKVK